MMLFLDISTSSCFFLLLCSFKLQANNSQKERERGKKTKRKALFLCKTMEAPVCPLALLRSCRHVVLDGELCGWKLFAAR